MLDPRLAGALAAIEREGETADSYGEAAAVAQELAHRRRGIILCLTRKGRAALREAGM